MRVNQIVTVCTLYLQIHLGELLPDGPYRLPQIQVKDFQLFEFAVFPTGAAVVHENRGIDRQLSQILMERGSAAARIDGKAAAVFHKKVHSFQISLGNPGIRAGKGAVKIHSQ